MGSEHVYDVGAEVVMQTSISDRDRTLVNPATVVLRVKFPDASIQTPTVTHDSLGVYEGFVVANQEGRYSYRWETTGGDFVGADEEHFSVRISSF